MRNVKEGDEGLYAVRVTGPNVNMYSSCRVSLSRASASYSGGRSSSYYPYTSDRSSARSSMAREISSSSSRLSPAVASLDHTRTPLSGSEYYTSTKYRVRSSYATNYNRYGYY